MQHLTNEVIDEPVQQPIHQQAGKFAESFLNFANLIANNKSIQTALVF